MLCCGAIGRGEGEAVFDSLTGRVRPGALRVALFTEVRCDLQAIVQCHFLQDIVDVAFHRVGREV